MATVELNGRNGETMVHGGGVEAFRRRLSGALVCRGEQGYDTARAVWNGMIDRRPAFIAYCANSHRTIPVRPVSEIVLRIPTGGRRSFYVRLPRLRRTRRRSQHGLGARDVRGSSSLRDGRCVRQQLGR